MFFPAYVDWDDMPRNTCRTLVEPAMKIKVIVEETLYGTAMRTVDVYIGREASLRLDPWPHLNGNVFEWGDSQGIDAGQRLGFGLVESGGIWTPNNRDFFEIYNDAVAFQSQIGERCRQESPLQINGLALSEIQSLIAACDFSDVTLGKDLKYYDVAVRIQKQSMGLCFDNPPNSGPNPVPACFADADCEVGQRCMNETCLNEY